MLAVFPQGFMQIEKPVSGIFEQDSLGRLGPSFVSSLASDL
jgi:hypothetical protein